MGTNASHWEMSRLVGKRVRELRLAQRKTLREVAGRTHIHLAQLSNLERGSRRVSVDDLVALAHALDCPATTLLAGSYLWA